MLIHHMRCKSSLFITKFTIGITTDRLKMVIPQNPLRMWDNGFMGVIYSRKGVCGKRLGVINIYVAIKKDLLSLFDDS